MEIRILLLDDKLRTAEVDIRTALSPLMPENAVLKLDGKAPATVKLRDIDGIEASLTFVCNPVNSARQVKRLMENGSFESEFDLVLLDDNWGETPIEEYAGQKILLEPTLRHIKGRNGEEPLVCVWTLHWTDDFRTGLLAETLRRSPYRDKTNITGLSKTDHAGLLLLVQRVIAMIELRAKNTQVELKLSETKARMVKHLGLLKSTEFKDKVVTPDLFMAIGERVEPFFQWKAGDYESTPAHLRLDFPVGIILEGDDEVFINAVSNGLEAALTDNPSLHFPTYKDDAPNPGGIPDEFSVGPADLLMEIVVGFFSYAANKQVVVVRGDDIEWSDSPERDLTPVVIQKVRSLLIASFHINAGRTPTDLELTNQIEGEIRNRTGEYADSSNGSDTFPLPGKIFWLFKRVGNPKTNRLLEAVENMLPPAIALKFSEDARVRRQVLEAYAGKRDCEFTERALNVAVSGTHGLSFGQLIGEPEWFSGSFLTMVEQKAKLRASMLLKEIGNAEEHDELKALIIDEIVRDVLDSLHLNLESQAETTPNDAVVADTTTTGSNGHGREQLPQKRRLLVAEMKLDHYEQLAQEISKERRIKTAELRTAIAAKLEKSPGTISQFAKSYEKELISLLNDPKNKHRWIIIRQISTFSKLINQPVNLLD
jgi:hypothetical protein